MPLKVLFSNDKDCNLQTVILNYNQNKVQEISHPIVSIFNTFLLETGQGAPKIKWVAQIVHPPIYRWMLFHYIILPLKPLSNLLVVDRQMEAMYCYSSQAGQIPQ